MINGTIPVRLGNSGGPLLNASTNLTGDVPQNINFAVKALAARDRRLSSDCCRRHADGGMLRGKGLACSAVRMPL